MKKITKKIFSSFGMQITRSAGQFIEPTFPIESTNEEKKLMTDCSQFSMTGYTRMWAIIQAMKHINHNSIEGDLVECGIWKGGNIALIRLLADTYKFNKTVYGFDTFDGMPDATDQDDDLYGNSSIKAMADAIKKESIQNIHAYAGIEQVQENLKSLGVVSGVKLIKGMVENTLSEAANLPSSISLLRLDTDWYSSTKKELEVLYPRLSKGGVLVIDDYGHFKGARKAVDEYFQNQNIWLHYVDYTCRLAIKE